MKWYHIISLVTDTTDIFTPRFGCLQFSSLFQKQMLPPLQIFEHLWLLCFWIKLPSRVCIFLESKEHSVIKIILICLNICFSLFVVSTQCRRHDVSILFVNVSNDVGSAKAWKQLEAQVGQNRSPGLGWSWYVTLRHGGHLGNQIRLPLAILNLMLFEEFRDGYHGGHLEYQNGNILPILNLHVAPMPYTKFRLNLTYHLGADVV